MTKGTKNVRNPHIFCTIPHILRTLEILQFLEFYFPLVNAIILFIHTN